MAIKSLARPRAKGRYTKVLDGVRYPMVDATEQLELEVRRRHSRGARIADRCECPIARAAKDQGYKAVEIREKHAWLLHSDGVVRRYLMGPLGQAAIKAFDSTASFPVVTVVLRPPPHSDAIGAHKKTGPKKTKKGPRPEPRVTSSKVHTAPARGWGYGG
jgi:hypothetical protein